MIIITKEQIREMENTIIDEDEGLSELDFAEALGLTNNWFIVE